MRKTTTFVVCCFVSTLFYSGKVQADDVKTTAVRIWESRTKMLVKQKNSFGDSASIQMTVQLKGADVAKATKYGKIKIDKAEDNLGNSLVKTNRFSFGRDSLRPLDRNQFRFGNEKPAEDEAEITLNMDAANRHAKTIAVVEGSMTLGISTTENVELSIAQLQKLVGKKINNATLKKMGVEVTVKSFSTKGNYISLEVTGKADVVSEINFEDAKGKSINSGQSSFGFNKKRTIQLNGSKTLPNNVKLVIPVETSLKEIVVKFRFTDIPLP